MTPLLATALVLASAAAPIRAVESNVVKSEHARVRLVSSAASVHPGETFEIAIRIDADAGWHTYWKNPGDSGLATKVAWTLPAGFEADPIVWPAPSRFSTDDLASYGYEGEVWLLVPMRAPAELRGKKATLAAKVDWLECADVCLPGSGELTLVLPVAKGKAPAAPGGEPPTFARARAKVPKPLAAPASASLETAGPSTARVVVNGTAACTAWFFPETPGIVEPSKDQAVKREGAALAIDLPLLPGATLPAAGLPGVLVLDGEAWQLTLKETSKP